MNTSLFLSQLQHNRKLRKNSVIVIGVAGGSASGKSTIAQIITEYFKDTKTVSILNTDLFYKDYNDELISYFNGNCNYDDPYMVDSDSLIQTVKILKQRKSVTLNKYSYVVHKHIDETVTIPSADIIILEGIFAWYWPELQALENLRIFVDCNGEFRLMRRLMRDVKERGRTIESVIEQYSSQVKPSYDKFIEPQRKQANLVLPWESMNGADNFEAVEMLINYISVVSGIGIQDSNTNDSENNEDKPQKI